MMTINQYDRNGLLLLFNSAEPHIQSQHNAICHIMDIRSNVAKEAQRLNSTRKNLSSTAIIVPLCLLFTVGLCFISSIFLIFFQDIEHPIKTGFWVITIIYFLILIIEELIYRGIYNSAKKHYNSVYNKALVETQQPIQYIRQNTSEHIELQIIPFQYQNPYIIGCLYNYLINYRATNWQEAINLYEQERQLNQINNSLQQNLKLNYQMWIRELELLDAIRSDNNFNALATAGLIFFK